MKALWAISWYMFLKIAASQTNRLLFGNWACHMTKSARTGDDKDSGSLLCCETSCNIAMLCSGTSASLQLKRTRFDQVHWVYFLPAQEEKGPSHCWMWYSSFLNKHVQGVKHSSLSILQQYTFPSVHITVHFNNLIVLFVRDRKMNLKHHVLPG